MAKVNIKDIKDDIKKFTRFYALDLQHWAAKEFTKWAALAIQRYYADYKDKSHDGRSGNPYYRTFNLMENSWLPSKRKKNGVVYGGVEISSLMMNDYDLPYPSKKFIANYGGNAQGVANITWLKGWHGTMHTTSPTPLEWLIEKTINNDTLKKQLMDTAAKKVAHEKYKCIKFY